MRNYFLMAMAILVLPATAYASCPAVTVAEMKGVAVVSALYAILNEQRRFLTQECGCPNAIDPCSVLRSFLNAIQEQAESDEGEPDSDTEKWTTMLSMPFTLAACYIAVRQRSYLHECAAAAYSKSGIGGRRPR